MASGIYTNRTNIDLPGGVSNEIIQKTQEESAVMRLARQIALPGRGVSIPVITSDPEANWVAETGEKPKSNPGLSNKVMTPYKLAVIVPFSDEFARDTAALYDALVARLPGALAKKFDATVFTGSAPGTGFDVLTVHRYQCERSRRLLQRTCRCRHRHRFPGLQRERLCHEPAGSRRDAVRTG